VTRSGDDGAYIGIDKLRYTYSALSSEFDLPITPPDPEQFVDRLAEECAAVAIEEAADDAESDGASTDRLADKLAGAARSLLESVAEELKSRGAAPNSLASAAIYVASKTFDIGISLNQKEVAEACYVSDGTVRKYSDTFQPAAEHHTPGHSA